MQSKCVGLARCVSTATVRAEVTQERVLVQDAPSMVQQEAIIRGPMRDMVSKDGANTSVWMPKTTLHLGVGEHPDQAGALPSLSDWDKPSQVADMPGAWPVLRVSAGDAEGLAM